MKTIFATMLAAAFLLSSPAFAGDEAPKDKGAKTEKKADKGGEKGEKKEEKKADKGGW
jgi:hypothetical protein